MSLLFWAPHLTAQNQSTWNPVEFGDHIFVPLSKVEDLYSLKKSEQNEQTIILRNGQTSLIFKPNKHSIIINGTKILSYHQIKSRDTQYYLSKQDLTTLLDPILCPKKFPTFQVLNTVILDPGHGGHDKGAVDKESQLTLTVVEKIKTRLEKKGIKVILTREKDEWVSLVDRVNIANAQKSAILVSLHFNSGPKAARGFETYFFSAPLNNQALHHQSLKLSVALHSQVFLAMNDLIQDRGIRRGKFRVLKECDHPSVLIEAGFLTNKEEAEMIESLAYQDLLAHSIAQGIHAYQISLQQ